MFSFREKLFSFFGKVEKEADVVNRDAQGRGLFERFVRVLGAEYDESVMPFIDNFVANCIDPQTALARFVPYLEQQMGISYKVSDSLAVRRKLVAWGGRITRIKGTKRSYEILLKLMGFTSVTIIEHFPVFGFDSPMTLDDDERRFDGKCANCTDYSLLLTGSMAMTDDLRAWIRSVIVYCEPINAHLREILYNGDQLALGWLTFRISPEGYLWVDNSGDPSTSARLQDGQLILKGPNAARYSLNSSGYIIYS